MPGIQFGQRGGPGVTPFVSHPEGGWTPRRSIDQESPLGGWTPRDGQREQGPLRSPAFSADPGVFIRGVTRDGTGAALASCVVQLFRTVDDLIMGEVTSDGSGNYAIRAGVGGPFYLVAYKAGGTDVAGTTVNTLIPVP
jgi:hypothetical protein